MGKVRPKKAKKEEENGQDDPKIHVEMQGAQNSQNNLEKERQSWRANTSGFQNLLHPKVIKAV